MIALVATPGLQKKTVKLTRFIINRSRYAPSYFVVTLSQKSITKSTVEWVKCRATHAVVKTGE